jgi:hypothetical protein
VRIGRRVPVVVASALVVVLVGGVAAAVTSRPSTAKACVTSGGALRLSTGGKCASGQTAITLGSQGPKGATGATGARGAKGATGATGPAGPAGATGPAGTAQRINFSQVTTEATTVLHALATSGPVTLLASCNAEAAVVSPPSPATDSLTLSVTGGTQAISFTASDVSSDATATPVVQSAVVTGSTISLGSANVVTDTTPDARTDVITVVISAQDGKQITGTLTASVNMVAGGPACTVNGTLASA